ncbi:MAG: HAMP domain-containing protein, partial [Deltaproteobacteria bacterium]|nr:HAMP domain-containing protein [Deltaproteobacteria bacterium]
HLLSRTVVQPIHKLLHIAESFKGGEPFPRLSDSSRNEIGRLYGALNMMLARLEEKEEQLKAHIASLEEANQTIQEAQAEIIKSEKLASLGRLATGVAHEIGNPIGIILGYIELLKAGAVTREEGRDFLNRIEVETSRINLTIRQLLDFSRPASGVPVRTKVHDVIMETTNMLKPQPMMARIEIEHLLEAAEDTVWADPNQIEQVFVNIIMNSADAMSDTENPDDHTPKVLTIKTTNRENSLEVTFADTGPGIPQEDLMHVFDPFYTTKEPGKGTGLGLAVCYRIIEGLGGAIRAENTPGQGTMITIDMPLYKTGEMNIESR